MSKRRHVCIACGSGYLTSCKEQRFCGHSCANKGSRNGRWKGGVIKSYHGYNLTLVGKDKRKMEHVLIAEKALGRSLPQGAVVHHHDENRANNANSNLVVCQDSTYHNLIHMRMRWIASGVDPDKEQRCQKCRIVKPFSEYYKSRRNICGFAPICKSCNHQRQIEKSAASIAAKTDRRRELEAIPPSGKAFAASIANASRTHCIHGHILAGQNLYLYLRKGHVNRGCRTCRTANSNKYKETRNAAIA